MATKEQAIELHDFHPSEGDLETEILAGLSRDPKQLPPKYFYDKVGAELFDAITETPEYYPTRTEQTIMLDRAQEIANLVGPQASLIEFGSGSGLKTRILLENLHELAAYVPVDISRKQLLDVAREFSSDYPNIEVLPVCADFTKPFDLPSPKVAPLKNVVFFPGSTIGNFLPDHALELLKAMARIACKGGALIIGVDLKKDEKILELAYNDKAGITAEFNRNMLVRMNRELQADFDLEQFKHEAIYNADKGRIEMHLVSEMEQTVSVAGKQISFDEGESIHTENSHKFSLEEFALVSSEAGFQVERVWTDPERLFSVQYLTCRW